MAGVADPDPDGSESGRSRTFYLFAAAHIDIPRGSLLASVADPDPVGAGPFLPDPDISPPNPDPALVIFKKDTIL